ncbi:MAG: hypothetical protein DMD25_11660 [Gemmatimonadetes bacterium]|nr:MAG: hypothetical protein DMD25_11660 [Gemmatimonadota bacterium]
MTPAERQAILTRACDLFNTGEYWLAHEALETVWRSILRDGDEAAARVWQGLIQGAAALLHQRRGNRHGVAVVGRSARCRGRNSSVPRAACPSARRSRRCASAGAARPRRRTDD